MIMLSNKTTDATGGYVGRGTALVNPFTFLAHPKAQVQVPNRAQAVIAQGEYRLELLGRARATHWAARALLDQLEPQNRAKRTEAMKAQLNALFQIAQRQNLTLVCDCTSERCFEAIPTYCHAENIARLLEQAINARAAP